jgi:hypothetical protein
MNKLQSEYALQSYLRQSAHQVIDKRHSLSTNEHWDLERRFVALSDKDLLHGPKQEEGEEDQGQTMNSLLDSLTGMCICNRQRPTKKKRVYPVEGFGIPLNTKHVVKKRLERLQNDHFFRPVSHDDVASF